MTTSIDRLSRSVPHRPRRRLAALVIAAGLAVPMGAGLVTPSAALAQARAARANADARDAAGEAALPIKRITLYRSGVGNFERSGTVSGGEEVQLRFATEQINDILKSMTVFVDPKLGRLDSVSYGSKEPLFKRLASFGVNIADNPSLPELLNRLRGAPIKVSRSGEEFSGTILGVEQRTIIAGEKNEPVKVDYLNVLTPKGMRSTPVNEINSFEILDKDLAEELNKALAALAEYRADRSKTVNLQFSDAAGGGGGAVPVAVTYVHEMPVWKTSYRLVLPESEENGGKDAGGGVTVQGWAIVENTTDEDWTDVRLALVSGRPVSFQMDLYEPLFTFRPMVPVPTVPGVAPRAYAGGVGGDVWDEAEQVENSPMRLTLDNDDSYRREAEQKIQSRFRDAAKMGYPAAPPAPAVRAAGESTNGVLRSDYAAAAQAQAGEVGEVFQYELAAPVTIERQRSAMIPILTSTLPGRRVSIYTSADAAEHPMRGVELTNKSDLQLLPGPISVYDGTAYAGDSQIGHVGQGDKRLLAYAVDLDVDVVTKPEGSSTVQHIKLVDGLLEQQIKSVNATSYAFKNNDEARPRTIVLEHTKFASWDLAAATPKPDEQTQDLYRFVFDVAPGKARSITVAQERVNFQRIGVLDLDLPTLLAYQRDGKVSKAVVDAVRGAADRQAEIKAVERQISEYDRQLAAIERDQNRIRQNMQAVSSSSEPYRNWVQKLSDQEKELERIANARAEVQAKLESLKNDYQDYVRGLNVE